MDILRYLSNEICCLVKASYDIFMQKIQELFRM
jgi:hypothetical protein